MAIGQCAAMATFCFSCQPFVLRPNSLLPISICAPRLHGVALMGLPLVERPPCLPPVQGTESNIRLFVGAAYPDSARGSMGGPVRIRGAGRARQGVVALPLHPGGSAPRLAGSGRQAVPLRRREWRLAVGQQLLPRHGAPQQIALQGVAAELSQQGTLLRGLHPFGHYAHPQGLA